MPGGPSIWAIRGPSTSGTQVKNGGTILYGGVVNRVNTDTVSSLTMVSADHGANDFFPWKDLVGTAGASGATTIISSGTYNVNKQFNYIMYQLKPVQYLAGLVSTQLSTPAGAYNPKSINFKTTTQTERMVQQGWNYVTGKFLPISGVVDYKGAGVPVSASDSFGTDYAAIPTRNLPGGLVYLDAGKTIASGYYKGKTD